MRTVLKVIALLVVALVIGACKPTADGGDNSGGSNTETETPESVVYTVAFDGNGGEVKSFNEAGELVVVSSIEVEPGTTLSSLPLSLLDNYAFLGWHDSKGIEFTRDTVVTKNITVTATLEVATLEGSYYVQMGNTYAVDDTNVSAKATGTVVIASSYKGLPVTTISERAFDSCNFLERITIPNSVTSIGPNAFLNCSRLTKVIIPYSIKILDRGTFHDCEALENITIPNSVTSIGASAFRGCRSLTGITIPDSVMLMGSYAFLNCTKEGFEITVEGNKERTLRWYDEWDWKDSDENRHTVRFTP